MIMLHHRDTHEIMLREMIKLIYSQNQHFSELLNDLKWEGVKNLGKPTCRGYRLVHT